MPKWVAPMLALLVSLALIPVACITKARSIRSNVPRLHLIQDMDNQGRFKAQQANALFADGRSMRRPVEGTVPRGGLVTDASYQTGLTDTGYLEDYPASLTVDMATLERGRRQFDIYCTPCHGMAGYGDGIVSNRADALEQGTWVPPASLHEEPALSRPIGHLFNTMTNGIRNMPAYGSQISTEDRWSIVTYIQALQRSQRADADRMTAAERAALR